MSVELILNALVAGAAAGASATATTAVTDAYAGVKQGVRRLFRRAEVDDPDAAADDLIARAETDRSSVTAELAELLDDAEDADLLDAARRVVELTGGGPKYRVDLRDNTGVQVGDNNTMTLNIDTRDRR